MRFCIQSQFFCLRDRDYIIKDKQILIIDKETKRVLDSTKFNFLLNLALELKEGCKPTLNISSSTRKMSILTFLDKFYKVTGLSGTAYLVKNEFTNFFNTKVVSIPRHQKNQRIDHFPIFFSNIEQKIKYLLKQIKIFHKKSQPILVCTPFIEVAEYISKKLKQQKIFHYLLTAKQDEYEDSIISKAGTTKSIIISTNMSGRGTDIKLGGNTDFEIRKILKLKNYTKLEKQKKILEITEIANKDKKKVIKLGGLRTISLSFNNNLRIDQQIAGRAGRKGNPGESFILSDPTDELFSNNILNSYDILRYYSK